MNHGCRYGDIDIDVANRDHILGIIDHTSAVLRENKSIRKHASGVYVTDIPYDPVKDCCSIDYEEAETRGYMKIDLLNVGVYNDIRDEEHLIEMMKEPDWTNLRDRSFVEQVIHINKHYDTMWRMPEPVDSIARMAMMIAVIRPGKRHLIGKTWREVAETVWKTEDEGYVFKKGHAIAYSNLVVVNMNLVAVKLKASA